MLSKNLMCAYQCAGLVAPSLSTNLVLKDTGEKLTPCVVQILSPYFPTLDLSKIRIHHNVPWVFRQFAEIQIAAITINEDIYFSGSVYDPWTMTGIKTIAHELTHTTQYKEYYTNVGFGYDYRAEYKANIAKGLNNDDSYAAISFEVKARANADKIMQTVLQTYDNNQPCIFDTPNPKKPNGYSQEVYNLQAILLQLGYLSDQSQVEGLWGNVTEAALKAFQARNNIKVDGIIGKQVRGKMAQPIGSLVRAK